MSFRCMATMICGIPMTTAMKATKAMTSILTIERIFSMSAAVRVLNAGTAKSRDVTLKTVINCILGYFGWVSFPTPAGI